MENEKLSRREQREEVVKRLYQMDMTSDFSNTDSNYKYITDMLDGVSENMDFIDDAISDNLINWKLNRLTYIDRAIMRCAVYEMYFTPLASEIVINEALNITRKYSDEGDNKTVKFMNKVLDNIKIFLKKVGITMDEKKYLSVTALTKYIKYKFDNDVHLKNVLLKGEISNFKHHSRGHFYFTLKDDKAQISAIMFVSNSKNVVFRPEDGMSVLVEGYLTVYEASGQYQIYVKKMDEDGVGSLHVAYEQLKKKLQEEGLFDPKHKIPIPKFPSTIAVLTSPTGAAVRDIINIVNRRYPLAKIIVYPTLVQGEFAKDDIVKNLKQVNKHGEADVIILGRGGGSIEDLWPFNEEIVAYEIFKSKIPIISSVGHETDFTISDFVADLRAPTPSGGAELAVPDQYELFNYLNQLESASKTSLKRLLKLKKERLERLKGSYIFKDPLRLTESKSRRYDHLRDKLELLSPLNRINQSKDKVMHLTMNLNNYFERYLSKRQNDYIVSINKLELLNPLNIMKKGYSVTKKDGKILKSVEQINPKDQIEIALQDGTVSAIVNEVRKDK